MLTIENLRIYIFLQMKKQFEPGIYCLVFHSYKPPRQIGGLIFSFKQHLHSLIFLPPGRHCTQVFPALQITLATVLLPLPMPPVMPI